MRRPDFRAVDLLSGPWCRRLHVERSQLRIPLLHRIGIDACADTNASRPSAPARGSTLRTDDASRQWRGRIRRSRCGWSWLELVGDALSVGAPVAFQLCLDPINRSAVAIGAFTTIAENGEPFDGRFIPFEIQTRHERSHWIIDVWRCGSLRGVGDGTKNEDERDDAKRVSEHAELYMMIVISSRSLDGFQKRHCLCIDQIRVV